MAAWTEAAGAVHLLSRSRCSERPKRDRCSIALPPNHDRPSESRNGRPREVFAGVQLLSVPVHTRSGQTLSIQFTVAPVPGPDGGLAGIVAVLRDVTATLQELKRLRADMRRTGP